MRIESATSRVINDSRGLLTIETTITAENLSATASVPTGKSTGQYEAHAVDASRAVENVNGEIASALARHDFYSLDQLDTFLIGLDGTPNKSRLGANAILSISIAATRLMSIQENVPLWKIISTRAKTTPSPPRLFVNVINGGVHAGFKLPFQEYMLIVGDKTSAALPIVQKAFAKLGQMLGSDVPMGEEGGYAPTFDILEKPFEILTELINEFPGTSIAIDAAASQFYKDGTYEILGKNYYSFELSQIYEDLVTHFPIRSIEDPFDENSHEDFALLTSKFGKYIFIVGDDLTATNRSRIVNSARNNEINAVLVKPNQIGTVREAIEAVQETTAAGFKVIASHRSGETDDTFIADFAYGVGAYGIKAGGLGQRERLEKYSRLLAIEHEAETV